MGSPMIGKIITSDYKVEIIVFNLKMTSANSVSSAQAALLWVPC